LSTGLHPAADRVFIVWHVMHRSVCCSISCRFIFRSHTHNALVLLRATQLLRFHIILPGSATNASIAAFGCRNGLIRD
jgi:hypothetical protein